MLAGYQHKFSSFRPIFKNKKVSPSLPRLKCWYYSWDVTISIQPILGVLYVTWCQCVWLLPGAGRPLHLLPRLQAGQGQGDRLWLRTIYLQRRTVCLHWREVQPDIKLQVNNCLLVQASTASSNSTLSEIYGMLWLSGWTIWSSVSLPPRKEYP